MGKIKERAKPAELDYGKKISNSQDSILGRGRAAKNAKKREPTANQVRSGGGGSWIAAEIEQTSHKDQKTL